MADSLASETKACSIRRSPNHSPRLQAQNLYPTKPRKAARYAFGIIKNHPFADGNKRTGTALMLTFLRGNGFRFKPRNTELYDTIIAVADGSMEYDELVAWIQAQL